MIDFEFFGELCEEVFGEERATMYDKHLSIMYFRSGLFLGVELCFDEEGLFFELSHSVVECVVEGLKSLSFYHGDDYDDIIIIDLCHPCCFSDCREFLKRWSELSELSEFDD